MWRSITRRLKAAGKFLSETWWVFRSFGIVAGLVFIKDSVARKFRRKPKVAHMFEDLTDEQAQSVAWAFGIYRWTDRKDLNRQWNDFERQMNTLH